MTYELNSKNNDECKTPQATAGQLLNDLLVAEGFKTEKTICDVLDKNDNNCPEEGKHIVRIGVFKVTLCDRCYENWKIGAYK